MRTLHFKRDLTKIQKTYNVKNTSSCSTQESRQMIYLPLLLVNELNFRVKDLMVSRYSTHFEYAGFSVKWTHIASFTHLKKINSSTVQLPLTVSYEGISLSTFRFWVHLHDVVYSLRQFGEIFVILLVSDVNLQDSIRRGCFTCTSFKKLWNKQNYFVFIKASQMNS